MNQQIAQVIGQLPNLTQEQIDSLTAFDTVSLDKAESTANNNHGFDAERQLTFISSAITAGVFHIARLAILGILSGDSSLTAPWTSIVGGFVDEQATEALPEAPVAPVADVAPVEVVPEVAPVEIPVAPVEVVVEASVEAPVTDVTDVTVPATADPSAGVI